MPNDSLSSNRAAPTSSTIEGMSFSYSSPIQDVDARALLQEIQGLRAHIQNLEQSLMQVKLDFYGPRVRIQQLEGTFKTLAVAPTSSDTDFQDGTLILSDVSGTRRIHVRIGGAWYAVTVT